MQYGRSISSEYIKKSFKVLITVLYTQKPVNVLGKLFYLYILNTPGKRLVKA